MPRVVPCGRHRTTRQAETARPGHGPDSVKAMDRDDQLIADWTELLTTQGEAPPPPLVARCAATFGPAPDAVLCQAIHDHGTRWKVAVLPGGLFGVRRGPVGASALGQPGLRAPAGPRRRRDVRLLGGLGARGHVGRDPAARGRRAALAAVAQEEGGGLLTLVADLPARRPAHRPAVRRAADRPGGPRAGRGDRRLPAQDAGRLSPVARPSSG